MSEGDLPSSVQPEPGAPTERATVQTLQEEAASSERQSVWPLAAVLGTFTIAILLLLQTGAAELDRYSREQSDKLAATAVAKAEEDLTFLTRDYSWWDAAVKNLAAPVDSSWADANVGLYAYSTLKVSRTLVLDANDRPVYAMTDGVVSANPSLLEVNPTIRRLAQHVRAASWIDPQPASTYLRLGNNVFLAAASAITPEETDELEGDMSRNVLVSSGFWIRKLYPESRPRARNRTVRARRDLPGSRSLFRGKGRDRSRACLSSHDWSRLTADHCTLQAKWDLAQ